MNQSHDLDEESEGQPDSSLLGIHEASEEHVSHTMGRFSPQGQEPEFGMSPSYSYTNGHQNTNDHHDTTGAHVMMFYATRPDSAQSHSNVQSIEEAYDDDHADSKRSYLKGGSAEDGFVASNSSPRRRRDADFSKYLKQARRSIGRHMST